MDLLDELLSLCFCALGDNIFVCEVGGSSDLCSGRGIECEEGEDKNK